VLAQKKCIRGSEEGIPDSVAMPCQPSSYTKAHVALHQEFAAL